MPFLALTNVTGYLPESEARPLFATAREAWDYLLTDRREAEDWQEDPAGYTATVNTLEQLSQGNFDPAFGVSDEDGTGSVWGETPGGAIHDLGRSYIVREVEAYVVVSDHTFSIGMDPEWFDTIAEAWNFAAQDYARSDHGADRNSAAFTLDVETMQDGNGFMTNFGPTCGSHTTHDGITFTVRPWNEED